MRTDLAFMYGEINRNNGLMVFDWNKAATIIKELNPIIASAGLKDDWEWTGGTIYLNGKPVTDTYTYLSSTWAVPELKCDDKVYPCFCMESEKPEWDHATKWPESAIAILRGEVNG